MRQLVTQFDSGMLTEAVATPTCSSCCCCCCCLTTAVASSSILTKRIATETKYNNVNNRSLLLLLSALFVPLSLAVGYFGFWTINTLASQCKYVSYSFSNQTYEACTTPGANYTLPLTVISPLLVLVFLYSRAHIPHPWKRSFLAMLVIAIGFAIEFFVGAFLLLSSAGIGYLIAIPFLWALAHKIYTKSSLSKPIQR